MKENMIKLKERLIEKFGCDNPIFTEEIIAEWNEYSTPRVAQLLREMTETGLISKYIKGVYYIPTTTALGKSSTLGFRQVIEKKYIQDGEEVYGYYTGLSLLNSLGLTTQVPNVLEVVTTKESTRVREVKIRNSKLILRKARTEITKDNVYALALLEVLNDSKQEFGKDEIEKLNKFVRKRNINQKDVFNYAKAFPGKAIKNLINIGVENVFTQR